MVKRRAKRLHTKAGKGKAKPKPGAGRQDQGHNA
jgi:hypothetical protein